MFAHNLEISLPQFSLFQELRAGRLTLLSKEKAKRLSDPYPNTLVRSKRSLLPSPKGHAYELYEYFILKYSFFQWIKEKVFKSWRVNLNFWCHPRCKRFRTNPNSTDGKHNTQAKTNSSRWNFFPGSLAAKTKLPWEGRFPNYPGNSNWKLQYPTKCFIWLLLSRVIWSAANFYSLMRFLYSTRKILCLDEVHVRDSSDNCPWGRFGHHFRLL